MIIVQTKNPVTHIDIDNMITGGTLSTKVSLKVGAYAFVVTPMVDTEGVFVENEVRMQVAYEYRDGNDNILPTSSNTFELTEGVKELSQSINGSLPADDNIVDRLANEVTAVAKAKLAERFGVSIDDVETV